MQEVSRVGAQGVTPKSRSFWPRKCHGVQQRLAGRFGGTFEAEGWLCGARLQSRCAGALRAAAARFSVTGPTSWLRPQVLYRQCKGCRALVTAATAAGRLITTCSVLTWPAAQEDDDLKVMEAKRAAPVARVTMTGHNDNSHTIADNTTMTSNTAAPATYWHGRPLDDVRRQPPRNPCAPFQKSRPTAPRARCYHTQRWPAQRAPSDLRGPALSAGALRGDARPAPRRQQGAVRNGAHCGPRRGLSNDDVRNHLRWADGRRSHRSRPVKAGTAADAVEFPNEFPPSARELICRLAERLAG